MLRFILLMAAMFVLPFIVWHVWRIFASSPDETGEQPSAPNGPLALTGVVLAIASSMVLALIGGTGATRDGRYEPARLVDGEIQPGGFVDDEDEVPADPPRRD